MYQFSKNTFAFVLLCSTFVWGQNPAARKADPWLGTWKLDLAKSTYSPGPAPKSQIVKIERSGEGLKVIIDTVTAQGSAAHLEFSGPLDGKDYPVKGSTVGDTYAYQRIDDRTFERIAKKNGQVTTTLRVAVSIDGKTQTTTSTGINAQGQSVRNVTILRKH